MTPSPFSAGNLGSSRGGIVDLPTPKRATNVYVGKRPVQPTGDELAALEMTSDGELPALLGDLGLDEVLDPALPESDSAEVRSVAAAQGLDLSDLPAPVGPRPRSPLSVRTAASAVSAARSMLPVSVRGPTSKPGVTSEPEPLPAPPVREPLTPLAETLPLGVPSPAKRTSRPDLVPLGAPSPAKRTSRPDLLPLGPASPAKRASRPDLLPTRPPLTDALTAPPPAERVAAQSGIFPPALRDTQPIRRTSPSGMLGIAKPVHSLFDASEPAPPAPRPTESTPPMLPLPALPSDESGGRPGAASASGSASGSASASGSEASGQSVQSVTTGAPGTSSTATTEPRPLRLGYLIVALAVLALLLAVIIARIAGIWNKQAAAVTEPLTSAPAGEPRSRPSP